MRNAEMKVRAGFGLFTRPSNLNNKFQITNIKRFDRLTTLSQVEGQITMTEIQNPKLLVIGYWNL
jgi:ArsR family metal-binding transcriptional regulator